MPANETVEVDAKGIPLKSGVPEKPSIPVIFAFLTIIPGAIGLAIAYAIITYASSTESKSAADAKLDVLAMYDLGWLYLGIFLIKLLQVPIYAILGQARKASKINVPDQHVYKVMGSEGSRLGYVLMETEDDLGKFNRAQRALQVYHEQFPATMMQYFAASFVWPFESFVCIIVLAVAWVLSTSGYVGSTDGRMRGRLQGVLAVATIQGLVLIAAYKALVA